MNAFLLWGLIGGSLCVVVHLSFVAAAKQQPVLSQAIELLISAVGASGGIKICRYVLTGQLAAAFKSSSIPLTEEDLVYFLVGAFALIWLSLETISGRLWAAYQMAKRPISQKQAPVDADPAITAVKAKV